MRLLKGLVIFLAIGGTLALVLAARAAPRPLTTIDRIQPAMNYAYVRVAGAVVGHPTRADNDGYLSFVIADASGQIRVSVYRQVARELLASGRVPLPGDHAELEGTLRIRDDDASLVLGASNALELRRPAPVVVALAALDALRIGERATTLGQVRRVRRAGERLTIVTLRDGSASADVPLPHDVFQTLPPLEPGSWVRVTGGAGEYRGARQLLPATADDIQAVVAPARAARPIAALNKDMLGEWVTVSGEVGDLQPFAQGMRLELRDTADGAIDIVAFESAWQHVLFSETLGLGVVLTVSGELTDYRGRLEIMPELAADIVGGR